MSLAQRDCAHVEATLGYFDHTLGKPVIPMYAVGSGRATRMSRDSYAAHAVPVHGARRARQRFTPDRESIELRCLSFF